MNNFSYRNPTAIFFGKGVLEGLGEKASALGKRAVLVYGKASAKKYGTYDLVRKQLKSAGVEVFDLGGVQENPLLSLARKGIELARSKKADFIIGLGGGSAIDTAKVIAVGAKTEADPWDIFSGKARIEGALPVVAVVTVPASASEANPVAVITNDELSMKAGISNPAMYPAMAFLDPALTATLPLKNTACAAVDIMAHVMEAYFTSQEEFSPVQDGYAEGLCKAVVSSMRRLKTEPQDYDARASMMWAATLAWNGVAQLGIRGASVPCHMLSYPISAHYGVVHGATLSILLPAWLRHNKSRISLRLLKFGENVFCLRVPTEEKVIDAICAFYREIGAPVFMSEAGVKNPDLLKMSLQAVEAARMRGVSGLTAEMALGVYSLAC
ncbi:MAG: iron-containing alcohol dehydrogenase [Elusimicrobia bacterium]|nr:iron-containing alcohol dehydrogenase [Elusimicrobiota bacterium]